MNDLGPAPLYRPGTLTEALEAETQGLGAVRFCDGRPYWSPGAAVRWEPGDAADEDYEASQVREKRQPWWNR